ncbi:hypothetical protein VNI00_005643 [Paramarasmius palmivorus]|uniref:Uncharacterized protein n=1 Tax=Paramarasmius palmivorus TaxID=297713 RepID=A0AAW0DDF0_9AGAR
MSGLNHGPLIEHLIHKLDTPGRGPRKRRALSPDPCLLERLPSSAFIQREVEDAIPRAILRQLRRSPTPPYDEEAEAEDNPDGNESDSRRERRQSSASTTSSSSIKSLKQFLQRQKETPRSSINWKDPQPYEVLRAVEQKDIMFLMEIRDRAFHLLLRKNGDVTPLLHAMRIGQTRDVAIVLLGAFSRYINHLDESELQKPKTKTLLKALRANLKLAIDFGLAKSQSDLTASFMQTLIMSEGDKWVYNRISDVSLALKTGTAGRPVHLAENAIRKFATRELGKAELIASLED